MGIGLGRPHDGCRSETIYTSSDEGAPHLCVTGILALPSVSEDGSRMAYVHEDHPSQLVVVSLSSGE